MFTNEKLPFETNIPLFQVRGRHEGLEKNYFILSQL